MKLIYSIILVISLFAFTVQADDFCINFYKGKGYKGGEAGVICGDVAPGGSAGAKSGNMSVGSFKAPSFLQVTLYEEKYFKGKSHLYKGPEEIISPAVHVGSVKWKNLKK